MKDFTTGSIPKMMFAFLVPLLFSNTLQAMYMLIDMMWAGKLLGATGVGIIATGMPVVFFLSSLIVGITVGAAILAGHAFGSGNREALSDIVSTSGIATVVISMFISLLGAAFCGPLLKLINTPAPLVPGAHIFLSLIILCMVPGTMVQWFASMMNAAGDSRTPFFVLLTTLILNAILAPLLITGAHIFPPLGIAGSAFSTIISNVVGVVMYLFVWRTHHLSEVAPFRFKVHLRTLKKIVGIGFPLSLQMLIVSSSFLFILSLANGFGQNVTAAFGIGSRVDQFAFLATFAVTAAISAMTAQNIGAGKLERIPEITRWGLIFSVAISLIFSGSVLLFPDAITGIFTKEPAVMDITRGYFHIAGYSYIALAVLFAYQGVLRGAGDTFGSFVMIAVSMIFLRVPLCYALSHYTPLKERGLWAGILIGAIVGAVAFYVYYKKGGWMKRSKKMAVPKNEEPECLLEEEVQTKTGIV
jgi:putative MATE family efflux protein